MQTQCMCYMHIKLPFKEEMMEKKLFSAPGAPESLKWVTRDEKLEMHTPIFDVMKVLWMKGRRVSRPQSVSF